MNGFDVEAVLSAHEYRGLVRDHFVCECQQVMGDRFVAPLGDIVGRHRAHLVAVLQAQIDEALETERYFGKSEAMESVLDPKGPIWTRMHGDGWDEGWDARTAAAHIDRPNDRKANPYRTDAKS